MTTANQSLLDTDYDLTPDQVEAYRRDGFIQLTDVLTGADLQQLRDSVAHAVEAESGGQIDPNRTRGVYEQIFIQKVNLGERHPDVKRFVTCRRFANLAARLSGKSIRVWHDQALFKEPRTGAKTPWHQDTHYWPHQQKDDQLTIWIALQDATIHNGCMSFIPGTHKIKTIEPINLANPQDIFQLAPQFKGTKPRTCELKAGSVTFHNGLTFHYAGPNRSDGMREAFAILYMPDGTTYSGAAHVVTDPLLPGLKVGDKLDGKNFPLVSDV
jgi:ectoine hydroxylase-related dioxygenase (phytanoyl-CoA dioxygenase family)